MLKSKSNKQSVTRNALFMRSNMNQAKHDHDPLRPHAHEPNPAPPSDDPSFILALPNGKKAEITPNDLRVLAKTIVSDCYIVSTGHGTSGPFEFSGAALYDLIQSYWPNHFSEIEIISVDGFGNRVFAEETRQSSPAGPILLAYEIDGQALTREQGLVRMIVPSERDDALRQVKWVGQIIVVT